MDMIKLVNLKKKYESGVLALKGLNLNIKKGEFVYIIGYSGAGKTSLIKSLYKELDVDSGRVIIDGKDVTKLHHRHVPFYRRTIGVVFQDYKLLDSKTVFENVAFALEVTNIPKKHIRPKTLRALELVGLKSKEKLFPHELSGGEQQRVAIARAIVREPKILIADEPTGNLDPIISEEILRILERINEEGITVVMATHDSRLVNEFPHRVVIIKDGLLDEDRKNGGYVIDETKF